MNLNLFSAITSLSIMIPLRACEPVRPVAEEVSAPEGPPPVAAETDSAMTDEPRFEPTECWWTLPESQPVECGYLIVPENRSVADSPKIRLATAILRHPGGNPEPDPIVYVHGGPSGGFMRMFDLEYPTLMESLETNRDVIYFDERGNCLREPSLDCPTFAADLGDLFDFTLDGERLTVDEAQDHLLADLVECGEEWGRKVDLSLVEHISRVPPGRGWENIILYGEYVLNRNLVRA